MNASYKNTVIFFSAWLNYFGISNIMNYTAPQRFHIKFIIIFVINFPHTTSTHLHEHCKTLFGFKRTQQKSFKLKNITFKRCSLFTHREIVSPSLATVCKLQRTKSCFHWNRCKHFNLLSEKISYFMKLIIFHESMSRGLHKHIVIQFFVEKKFNLLVQTFTRY